MFRLNRAGDTNEWLDNLGRLVLHPHYQNDNKTGGGLFVYAGMKLPRHGPIRQRTLRDIIVHEGGDTREHGVLTDDFFMPFSEVDYPWVMSVRTRVVRDERNHELTYASTIMRSTSCQNPRPMPCSLGLHPYFATHGGNFKIIYRGQVMFSTADDLRTAQYFDLNEALIQLETDVATISIKPWIGFDRVFVWTDNPGEYVCIEPTTGVRSEYLLEPGQFLSGTCVFSYKAKGI